MTDLKQILTDIAKAIVDNPNEVTVILTEDDRSITLSLNVAAEDMGMVIGKNGKIAKAIRTVMKAAATSAGLRVRVDILDSDELAEQDSDKE